ncbi:MAG: cache domain-containing protein [Desulfovibrio sp.]
MKMFRKIPLSMKLFFSYSFLFLLVVTVGGIGVYSNVKEAIETSTEEELKRSTLMIKNIVETAVHTSIRNYLRSVAEVNKDIVKSFYDLEKEGGLTGAEAQKRATQVLLSQKIGKSGYVYCLNSDAELVVHPLISKEDFRGSEVGFVKEQVAKRRGYLEYQWQNPDDDQMREKMLFMVYFAPWDWIISVSVYRDEFLSLVDVADFKNDILNIKFDATGYPLVIDSEGLIVIHPELVGNMYNAADGKGTFFVREICEKKTGTISYFWRRSGEREYREKLAAYDYIPEYDWIVVSSGYKDEFTLPLEKIETGLQQVLLYLVLLIFPASLYIGRKITNPIHRLREAFKFGVRGDLNIRLSEVGTDEFDEMAECFNLFMARLEKYNKALESEILHHRESAYALRENERFLRTLMENLPGMVYCASVNDNWIFTYVSQGALRITGYDTTQLVSVKSLYDFIHPEDLQRITDTREAAIAQGTPYSLTYRLIDSVQALRWVSEHGRGVVGSDGTIAVAEGFVADITDSMQTIEFLREKIADLEGRLSR